MSIKLLFGISGGESVTVDEAATIAEEGEEVEYSIAIGPVFSTPHVKPYHTKGKDDWGTPHPLFELLDQQFGFTLDVCADEETAKCPVYLTEDMDALKVNWWGRVFMNPPFSKLDKFLAKMIEELVCERIEVGVALVAARTDTMAMFAASSYAGEIRFLKGRVSYLIYPSPWQRAACEALHGMGEAEIDPSVWSVLVKNIQLPKLAIKALIENPNLPGGDPKLSQSAPFPSTVLIFDRRKRQRAVFWDWKAKVKTTYAYGEGLEQFTKVGIATGWESTVALAGHKTGKGKGMWIGLVPPPVSKSIMDIVKPPSTPEMPAWFYKSYVLQLITEAEQAGNQPLAKMLWEALQETIKNEIATTHEGDDDGE